MKSFDYFPSKPGINSNEGLVQTPQRCTTTAPDAE